MHKRARNHKYIREFGYFQHYGHMSDLFISSPWNGLNSYKEFKGYESQGKREAKKFGDYM